MKSKAIQLYFILLLFPSALAAQWVPSILQTPVMLTEKTGDAVLFSVDMNGFFKNNEYFHPIAVGRTLPGISFLPAVAYQWGTRFRAEFGAYNVFFSGDQQKHGVRLFSDFELRMQYAFTPRFQMVFGRLYGGLNHKLIEPLYQWERHLVDKPENGLQLVFQNERHFVDLWVDWQRYIERGDTVPEMLTFGLSAATQLTAPDNQRWKVTVPLQLLIYHQGGQIDTSDEPMEVVGNLATGIDVEWMTKRRFIRSIDVATYLVGYYDKLQRTELRPYTQGWGVYPVVKANGQHWSAMVGYWYGYHFYSKGGEPLFASFNPDMGEACLPTRQMVTAKLSYTHTLTKGLALVAQGELYNDVKEGNLDYSFGVALRFNADFVLKRLIP